MGGYTKLFSRLLDSTVWREDDKTRILWITMLALADRDGNVLCTIPGLADRARITIEECETALAKFQQPDKYSWSKDEEGRKIRPVDGGWFLINHAKYRALMSEEDRRERTRLRVEKWRAKQSLSVTVTNCNAGNDKHKHKQIQKEENQNPSALPCFPPDFDQTLETGNNGKPVKKHTALKELVFKCFSYLNDGEKPAWDGSDAKQLSLLIKAKPDLDEEKFHAWLVNYSRSENINPAARPREFLPHITSYSGGPLNRYGKPQL